MNNPTLHVYSRFIGFRAQDELHTRLQRFSGLLGRHKSDVIRYMLLNCLNAYEADKDAIAKIRQELY